MSRGRSSSLSSSPYLLLVVAAVVLIVLVKYWTLRSVLSNFETRVLLFREEADKLVDLLESWNQKLGPLEKDLTDCTQEAERLRKETSAFDSQLAEKKSQVDAAATERDIMKGEVDNTRMTCVQTMQNAEAEFLRVMDAREVQISRLDVKLRELEEAKHMLLGQEALRQEALKQEALKQEALKQEALKQEALKQEALKQELMQEALRQDELKQEALRQEAQQQAGTNNVLPKEEVLKQEDNSPGQAQALPNEQLEVHGQGTQAGQVQV